MYSKENILRLASEGRLPGSPVKIGDDLSKVYELMGPAKYKMRICNTEYRYYGHPFSRFYPNFYPIEIDTKVDTNQVVSLYERISPPLDPPLFPKIKKIEIGDYIFYNDYSELQTMLVLMKKR